MADAVDGQVIRNVALQQCLQMLHRSERLHWTLGSARLFRHGAGRLSPTRLIQAFDAVLERHPVLASSYALVAGELMHQPDLPSRPDILIVHRTDLQGLAQCWLTSLQERLVDDASPFCRFLIGTAASGELLLGLAVSHMLLDGQSLQQFWLTYEQACQPRGGAASLHRRGLAASQPEPPCLQLQTAPEPEAGLRPLPPREQTYWQWLVEQFCADPARQTEIALLPIQRDPFLVRCRSGDPLMQVLAARSDPAFTAFENAVALLLSLLSRQVGLNELLIMTPLSLRPAGREDELGYWIDARPLPLLEMASASHGDLCAQVRAGLRRISSLPDPWLSRFAERAPASTSLAGGSLLISRMAAEHCPVLDGIPSRSLHEEELRGLLAATDRPARKRQALTARTPFLALKLDNQELLLRSNVRPLLTALATLTPAADPDR